MEYAIVALVALAVGIGLGRIKNAGKLAAVKAEVAAVEAKLKAGLGSLEVKAQAEISALVASIKKHL